MLEEVDCSSLIAVVLSIQASQSFPSSSRYIFRSRNRTRKPHSKQRISAITRMKSVSGFSTPWKQTPLFKAFLESLSETVQLDLKTSVIR
ncbi:hypothetical protein LSTR_LSTR004316 [Laodelphax striatellus]|uniref:Uncharacterized protein n=1 Tax=Laodelphax striatellus TaxID=195883 RepID=A0A482X8Y3_LAOST|nr:hypothetical protein LSTR_LSTR004316 [Laodelphax striatellus]